MRGAITGASDVWRNRSNHSSAPSRPKHLFWLFKTTFNEWLEDKAPQLGAALAYYTVFSLAPLILVLLAIIGVIFRNDPDGAWEKITEQMSYFLDPSGVQVVQDIAKTAAKPSAGLWATIIGVALALFGASGVFGQLQDALNTIWGVKAKPGAAFWDYIRIRFLSFAMVAGVCFLLLVTLTIEALLERLQPLYRERRCPGGAALAFTIYHAGRPGDSSFCSSPAMFKYLPDVEVRWRDVVVGAAMTAFLFLIGKWALGLYLGSGAAGSAYGAASSLVTLLLWIYYSSQILALRRRVHAGLCEPFRRWRQSRASTRSASQRRKRKSPRRARSRRLRCRRR